MTKASGPISRRSVIGMLGVGLVASGCASTAPEAFYGLQAGDVSALQGGASRVQLLVAPPRALKALDTTYIAVVDEGPVYTYFRRTAWADTLPNVVQIKLMETLQNTGRLRGVGLPGDGLLIDYQLQTELRSFELRLDGGNRGLVEIAARIVNDRNGRTVASQVFTGQSLSGGTSVDQAVAAMNAAADQVFSEIAAWTLQNV